MRHRYDENYKWQGASFVCYATPGDPHKTWDLLRLLNDPLARATLRFTRPDLHNLED